MGSWRKVGAFLGLVPDDHRAYDADDYDRGSDRDTDRDYDTPHYESGYRPRPRAVPPVDFDSTPSVRPVTVKLTGFGEARIVGEKFRDRQSVILDMTAMDDADARRLVDFAAGLAFALRGSIDKVTTKVFMLLPPADLAGAGVDDYARDAVLEDARRMAAAR